MAKEKKVYDYKPAAVRDALVGAFKARRGEATVADLVAVTGLPNYQVETELRPVADEFGARLRVTESGEIAYSFPGGMRSRYRGFGPSLARALKAFAKGAKAVGVFLFKAWIAVMLVGYFVLFVALAVLAVVASVAASSANKDNRRRSRSDGGLFLADGIFRIIMRIWFYNEVWKSPGQRAYETERRMEKAKTRRPLRKAVYSFVFGDGDGRAEWNESLKKDFVSFVRSRKGVIALEEFMALTGLSPLDAEDAINRYCVEFEGSPEVTSGGTIYYFFPELLRSERVSLDSGPRGLRERPPVPFSINPPSSDRWYCVFNLVNLLFGGYFLYGGFAVTGALASGGALDPALGFFVFVARLAMSFLGVSDPIPLLMIGLGAVPVTFAVLFYLIPLLRSGAVASLNKDIGIENLRRRIYARVWGASGQVAAPADSAQDKDAREAKRAFEELAAYEGADVAATEGAGLSWTFPEVERKRADVDAVRASVDLSKYELGKTVFDSGS